MDIAFGGVRRRCDASKVHGVDVRTVTMSKILVAHAGQSADEKYQDSLGNACTTYGSAHFVTGMASDAALLPLTLPVFNDFLTNDGQKGVWPIQLACHG